MANPRQPQLQRSPVPIAGALGSVLAALLCACSGNGIGLDANGQPITSTSGSGSGGQDGMMLSADFDSIQANVFTPICSVCHIGATAPQGLRLDAQDSYALLVGVPSTEVPALLRVKPGDPDNSYLVQKLEGHAAVGGQMPLGETPLPSTTIAFIRQWITDGAQLPASMAPAEATFAVAAVAPGDAEVLSQPPAQIVVAFNRELDAASIDPATVRLECLPSGSIMAPVPPVPVPVQTSIPTGNPHALLLTPQQPLVPGRYRLVLDGPGIAVAAIDGERLSAPSAGVDGGRTIIRFAITGPPAAAAPRDGANCGLPAAQP